MVASYVEGEGYFHLDHDYYNEELNKVVDSTLPQFDRIIKSHVNFNFLFAFIGIVELLFLVISSSFLLASSMLAFCLAFLFLTLFSYFILRSYFQAKKPTQLEEFNQQYIRHCKLILKYRDGIPEHHVALATACCKLVAALEAREYSYYRPLRWMSAIAPTMEKMSCWCFWQDLYRMKELLLQSSIDEHVKLVHCEPTSLDIHAALANAYVMLSSLYSDPRQRDGYDDERWIPSNKYNEEQTHKFRSTAERAIEELKILNDYAPNDPWVHMQLAYSYHDLGMPEEEIKEYEIILRLRPEDKDNLFKLGRLYFEQGKNSQGLRIFEELKRSNFKKAEQLIAYYGCK